MTDRHARQRRLYYLGLLAHGFSASKRVMLADNDTAPDVPNNYRLDQKDADGDRSDGVEEGLARYDADPTLHNLKNYTREVIEARHPKTTARLDGLALLKTHAAYLLFIAGMVAGILW